MRMMEIDVHHRAVGEVGNLVEPRDRRDRRSPTDIDEDAIGTELYSVHRHSLVSDKAGMGFVNRATVLSERSTPCRDAPAIASFRALTARISTPTGPPMVTP